MTDITRMGVTYRQLPNGTITCGPLDQSGKVGGSGEELRNQEHNPERLHRILQLHRNPKVLDFGCGSGMLVEFLRDNRIEAFGFDRYLKKNTKYLLSGEMAFAPAEFDIVTMVEVVEHLSEPYLEFEHIFHLLKPGGVVMIETTFTNWMDLWRDPYIDPVLGHSTIFSHQGLDEVMVEKGFEVYGHINRNVRLYKKPEPPFDSKITLITMGQGNPIALKRTLDSFKGIVDEFVFGDFLIFDADRALIESYKDEYNLKIFRGPFNFIFEKGFARALNALAELASNDWILYMNVSEVLDGEHPIKEQMSREYNAYSFDHAVDPHRWFRLYNRKELQWEGVIHEEVRPLEGKIGRPCEFNIFRMQDTEKDLDDPFKAKVANDVKELCYFQNYLRLVDEPVKGATHSSWVKWATESYQSFKERLEGKGNRYRAFLEGNLTMYLEDIYTNPEFENERFQSSQLINFQGDRKLL